MKKMVGLSVTRLAKTPSASSAELQTMQKAKRQEKTLMRVGPPELLRSTESA